MNFKTIFEKHSQHLIFFLLSISLAINLYYFIEIRNDVRYINCASEFDVSTKIDSLSSELYDIEKKIDSIDNAISPPKYPSNF